MDVGKKEKEKIFFPDNRKYIGAKTRLLHVIKAEIARRVGEFTTFIDLFAGTGIVAYTFAREGKRIIANDHLTVNYLGLVTFLYPPTPAEATRLPELLAALGALPPAQEGYCRENYGGTYFTLENAGRIDAIRETIAVWSREGRISAWEEAALITSLLYAADKVANTCGQYDAFLKNLGAAAYDPTGRHLVDATVYKPLTLLRPAHLPPAERGSEPQSCFWQEEKEGGEAGNRVYQEDANHLIERLEGDVLYLDPPYNTRQYFQNYHVLENIATWRKPSLRGKTRKWRDPSKQSAYSSLVRARQALLDLLSKARAPHLFFSYNSEGILSHEEILEILGRFGTPTVCETDYNVFGNGAGQARRRVLKERLYYCRLLG